jgi:protein tyrosine/serine phosphatase
MSSTPKTKTATSNPKPGNFGTVISEKLYRSQYPEPENFQSLVDLKIKTVLTLVPEPNAAYEEFLTKHSIKHIIIPLPANKGEISMDFRDIISALFVALNVRSYPLLIHCNKGKHRTGCVVACLQQVLGQSQEKVLITYQEYARDKARRFDIEFIKSFPEEVRQFLNSRFVSSVDAPDEPMDKLPEQYRGFQEPQYVFKPLTNAGLRS